MSTEESTIKKLFIYILNILALVPVISLVSLLLSGTLIFPVTIIPPSISLILPQWIVEIILGISLILYGRRLNKLINERLYKRIYWAGLVITILIFLLWKYRFVILLQSGMLIIYCVLFENRLQNVKEFFQKSRDFFAFLNFFDTCFIASLFLVHQQEKQINEKLSDLSRFLGEIGISSSSQEAIIVTTLIVILLLIIPILRVQIIRIYIKQNNISINSNKTLFSAFFMMFLTSVLQIAFYFAVYLTLTETSILIILFLMFLSVLLWYPFYTFINNGGETKENEIRRWLLSIFLIIFLALLDQIESDLIGILTWFVPVLIPTFIGEINSQKPLREGERVPEPTLKMKTHLYRLQMVSFNTLVILNILSSLSTVKMIKNSKIIEVNAYKNIVVKAISSFNSEASSDFFPRFMFSFIMVVVSVFISMIISKGIIWLLKKYYLDPSKGYFKKRRT
ncbi:hypothetical protein [Streptococcus suis]|uniref:Uncharacterized protein n=1 Tax=Streptococcus suis TaxID=1307 RepID=A0A116MAS2_STRSU|nr:hypothetical protein [Streptococcus suis]NQG84651.1 ABC transporter permease [Streptococcus suis]CYV37354.1 Uncharacterised protein [Streptococcus suis]HEM3213077.1 ABC transporter permease [Streptococcus suis 12814]HEM4254269.1 ABC transporter permease [Streptococcus suis]